MFNKLNSGFGCFVRVCPGLSYIILKYYLQGPAARFHKTLNNKGLLFLFPRAWFVAKLGTVFALLRILKDGERFQQ